MTQMIEKRTYGVPDMEPLTLPDDLPAAAGPVGALARDYPDGFCVLAHAHPWSQLLHAVSGVMRVTTPEGTWVLPPGRALWVPPGTRHALRMEGRVAMRTLFVAPEVSALAEGTCKIVTVSGLLRELILASIADGRNAASIADGQDAPGSARTGAVQALILDELRRLDAQPLYIPIAAEPRLKAVCDALLADPGRDETLDQWADSIGVSGRTLARLFHGELGLGFVDWRRQVRLAEALARLTRGVPVAVVSHALGYASPAAFSAMFRRTLGCAPRDCAPHAAASLPGIRLKYRTARQQ